MTSLFRLPLLVARPAIQFPKTTISAWFIAAAVAYGIAALHGGTFQNASEFGHTNASQGAMLLQQQGGAAPSGSTAQIVVTADSVADHRDDLVSALDRLDAVTSVDDVSPALAPGTVSQDGTTAIVDVRLHEPPKDLSRDDLSAIRSAFADMGPQVQVSYAGALGASMGRDAHAHLPELLGLIAALLVMLVLFRSFALAIIPLVSAVLGTAVGLAALRIVATQAAVPTTAPTLATMLGLGCGIDYALFVTMRFRQRLHDGASGVEAAREAVTAGGRAVLIAASTVALALSALSASGIELVGRLGLASVATLAASSLAALTLVPAALVLVGTRARTVNWRREPGPRGASEERISRGAILISRHPWKAMLGALAVLGVLTVPLLSIDLGHLDEGDDPVGSTTRTAHDALTDGFGPGSTAPVIAVLDQRGDPQPAQARAFARREIDHAAGVASVSGFASSDDGQIAHADVVSASEPQSPQTEELVDRLGGRVAAVVADETGSTLFVTGPVVAQIELAHQLQDRLVPIIALVVGASLLLLAFAFRSPVIAVKAAHMNLLSISASFGVLVAVFQWQWGSGLLGFDHPVPIESYVPMMMFVIVFGLSMDYEVLLLTRVQECWRSTADNVGSVVTGLSSTSRVITAAAAIMVVVFLGFCLNDDAGIKMLAVGLAVSVVVDVTVVRLLLVPSVMILLGTANWWRPRWRTRSLSPVARAGTVDEKPGES